MVQDIILKDRAVQSGSHVLVGDKLNRKRTTTAKLPVITTVPHRTNPEFRLVFFADLHSAYQNMFKIANFMTALRHQISIDVFASLGDLVEGGQYPQQLLDMIQILNGMRLDFTMFGNHEFDFEDDAISSGTRSLWQELQNSISRGISQKGQARDILLTIQRLKQQLLSQVRVIVSGKNVVLEAAIRKAQFPFLTMNLNFEPGSRLNRYVGTKILPFYLRRKNGRLYAFIGVTTESLTHEFGYHKKRRFESTVSVNPEPIADQLARTITQIKEQQKGETVHIIVASHLGLPGDIELVGSVSEIDLVLGSHTHNIAHKKVVGPDGREVSVIHTGLKGQVLGIVDVEIIEGQLVADPYLIDIERQEKPQKTAGIDLEDFIYRPRVIGRIDCTLSMKHKSTQPSPLFNFITDVYRLATGANVAFSFAGNVRDGLTAGEVTESDIENMLPWPTTLSVVTVSGRQIIEALEFAAASSLPHSPKVLLLHPSGLTYSITKAGKIENVRVLKDGDYAPLNLDEQYRVALPQYLAQEGIAGFPLSQEKAIEYIQTDRTDKEIIMAAFLESETSVVVDETPRISIDPAADLLYNDPEIVY